jgi:hypothetical protein
MAMKRTIDKIRDERPVWVRYTYCEVIPSAALMEELGDILTAMSGGETIACGWSKYEQSMFIINLTGEPVTDALARYAEGVSWAVAFIHRPKEA